MTATQPAKERAAAILMFATFFGMRARLMPLIRIAAIKILFCALLFSGKLSDFCRLNSSKKGSVRTKAAAGQIHFG